MLVVVLWACTVYDGDCDDVSRLSVDLQFIQKGKLAKLRRAVAVEAAGAQGRLHGK